MPYFVLSTNIKRASIPDSFLTEASGMIAKILGKPEPYVCVRVCPDQLMSFGGSTEACGFVELESLGNVGPGKNQDLVKAIGSFVQEKLGIQQDRFYIKITDLPRTDLGYNGKTFG